MSGGLALRPRRPDDRSSYRFIGPASSLVRHRCSMVSPEEEESLRPTGAQADSGGSCEAIARLQVAPRDSRVGSGFAQLAGTVQGIRASRPRQQRPRTPAAKLPITISTAGSFHRALGAAPAGFVSLIFADFPRLFAEFPGKRFTLLWRNRRNGLGARGFHSRRDRHALTLALIQDTKGAFSGGTRSNTHRMCAYAFCASVLFSIKWHESKAKGPTCRISRLK
jgi:hypothetical protein